MAWLLRDGDVLAVVEDRPAGWARGLPSADIHGVVVVTGRSVVHSLGSSSAFDVAWCVDAPAADGKHLMEVRRMVRLGARRLILPRMARGATLVATSGSFERWNLHIGDRLEIT